MSDWPWAKLLGVGFGVLAAMLAWRKTDGWGWFLFIAFLCVVSN